MRALTGMRAESIPLVTACDALGVPRSTFYARQAARERTRARSRKPVWQPRALTAAERQRVHETLNSEEFINQPPLCAKLG
jgi:hypothetical protein